MILFVLFFSVFCLFVFVSSVCFQNISFLAIPVFFGLMLVKNVFLISVVGSCFLFLFLSCLFQVVPLLFLFVVFLF